MNSDILLLNWDSIFDKIDIESLIKLNGYWCLVKEVSEPEKYWIFKEENSIAKSIVEKPQEYIWNLANLWVYKFSKSILDLVDIIELSPRWEFEITDAINSFIEQENFKLITIIWDFIDIGYPEDIEVAENLLKSKYRDIIKNKPIFWDIVKIDSIGNLNLCYWIDSNLIKMLIDFSQDESDIDLQKNAGDKKRFTTRENIEKWYNSTDRIVLTLVDDSNYIAWIWWWRPCDMPIMDNQNQEAYRKLEEKKDKLHTSAVRIYREYRWKKISSKFVELCLKYYRLIHSNWIMCADVNDDNIAMKKWFLRAWYTELWIWENKKSIWENTSIKRKIFIKEF